MKEKLASTIWETQTYYHKAHDASDQIDSHPMFPCIREACAPLQTMLDIGCGEGTKMAHLLPSGCHGTGVDISQRAIAMGKKAYPQYSFQVADITKLPFEDASFEGVMTFFVLEHTDDPAKTIDEMLRVLRPGGILIILCPNFGSPLFRSPVSTKSRLHRMGNATLKSLRYLFSRPHTLEWEHVEPFDVSEEEWRPDYDTTVEPYLQTATAYLCNRNCRIRYQSSMWEALDLNIPAHRILKPFAALAHIGLYPFQYWGPQLAVIAEKMS